MKTSTYILKKRKVTSPQIFGGEADICKKTNGESGFSLVEVIFAMVILLVALLGVFVTFTYSISYNAGNSSRSQALAILQQEIEQMRSKKFTSAPPPNGTDPALYGVANSQKTVTALNGNKFKVTTSIDNNPLTPAIDVDESVQPTIKQITVTVTLDSPTPGWQTSLPATVVLQRVRGN